MATGSYNIGQNPKTRHVFTISQGAVEWAQTHGYGPLMNRVQKFLQSYRGAGHRPNPKNYFVNMTPSKLAQAEARAQRTLARIKAAQTHQS